MRLIPLLLIALFTHDVLAANPASPASTVTIPVQEYLSLVRQNEKPRFVSVLNATLTGRYGERLTLTLNGQASSLNDKREFLRFDPQNMSFENCQGDAQIAFDGGGASLLPTSPKFTLRCELTIKNWSQVELTLVQAMGARAEITGAESLVLTDASGDRQINITKAISGARPTESMPVSAVGRFRITLLPESTRFSYDLQIENPSRGSRSFEIRFQNGEIPSRIATDAEYTEGEGVVQLRLKPGANSVQIEGPFAANEFKSPVAGGPHYLLIENHQLLQVNVTAEARRISARDAGIVSRFAGQRAYLLQKGNRADVVAWTTKKLEVLPALGFSIESASYNYFIPTRGKGVVEASFRVNNQGQPEIPLSVEGRPLYLEVDGQPQVLATNAEGQLLLQLTPGVRDVYLQYEAPHESRSSFGLPYLRLAKPASVMSQIEARLSFEDGASLIWAQGLSKSESDLFEVPLLVRILIFFAIAYLILARAGVAPGVRIGAAVAFGILGGGAAPLALLALVAGALGWAYRHRRRGREFLASVKWTWDRILAAVLVGGFAGLAVTVTLVMLLWGAREKLADETEFASPANMTAGLMQNKMQSYRQEAPAMDSFAEESDGGEGGRGGAPLAEPAFSTTASEPDYQGLPAKVVVPVARRVVEFRRGLIEAGAPVVMFAAYTHPGVPRILWGLALLAILALAYSRRRQIRLWLQ